MNFKSLLPLIVFIAVFLGSGIISGDFYALPAPIAVFAGIITAFILFFRNGIHQNIETFIRGCGNENIVMMCLIVLLCGAFSKVTTAIGATETVVHLAQSYLSPRFLYAGVFILASFLSFSSGTSVGAISTLTPIVAGFVQLEGIDTALIAASLLSGAMFGDNLSIISDTTIVATQSQGCSMKDKFRTNSRMAFPASILTVIILMLLGFYLHPNQSGVLVDNITIQWLKILPYLFVITMALAGVNVFITLFLGVVFAGAIGGYEGLTLMEFLNISYNGFSAMTDVFLVFFLTGGLAYMVEKQGGIEFIIQKMSRFMTSKLRAKIGIASLVALVDAAVANNTVAIMVSGSVAKRISERFKIPAPHTASILDIISCIVQGLIPYGAQVLILFKLMQTDINYSEMVSKAYYLWLLLLISIIYFIKQGQRGVREGQRPIL